MALPILGEVFGYKPEDLSDDARRHREERLCPFGNVKPRCTKDKKNDPLGVCSVRDGDRLAITCPVRFREGSIAVKDAARFFFPGEPNWVALPEVQLKDRNGQAAGNIDYVIASYDSSGQITDFGALEVQAVYISGNVREPFKLYMERMAAGEDPDSIDLSGLPNPPHPDYLSSSRKRLAPQLLFKGGIVKSWGKKQAVVVNKGLWETMPDLAECPQEDADLAWFVYDLVDGPDGRPTLVACETAYTKYRETMKRVTEPIPGKLDGFMEKLQKQVDGKLKANGAGLSSSL